jgi:hypothetical protein
MVVIKDIEPYNIAMVDEGYAVPDAQCDSCNRQGLTLYHRFGDRNGWLCKRCVNQKKFAPVNKSFDKR